MLPKAQLGRIQSEEAAQQEAAAQAQQEPLNDYPLQPAEDAPGTLTLPTTEIQGKQTVAPQSMSDATTGSTPDLSPQIYSGGTKPGSIRATPAQGTADLLNLDDRQKQIYNEGGNNDLETGQLLQRTLDQDAKDKH